MAANLLVDAFEVCVSQIARGQTVEQVVALYPQFAVELRLMLTVGSAAARYELPTAEVEAARARVQPGIDDLIDSFPDRGLPPWVIPLGILLVIAIVTLLFMSQPGGAFAPAPTQTPSLTPTTTQTGTPLPSITPTLTPTLSPNATPTDAALACTQALVLEGPIEAIRGNQLVIYGLTVVTSDPARYRVGMVVRAAGCTCDGGDCTGVTAAAIAIPTAAPVAQATNPPAQGEGAVSGGSPPASGDDDDDGDDDGDDDSGDD